MIDQPSKQIRSKLANNRRIGTPAAVIPRADNAELKHRRGGLWQRSAKWLFPNSVATAAFLAVYSWVCSYWYLSGFEAGFGTNLDRLGLDQSIVTGRIIASVFVILPIYLLFAAVIVSVALLLVTGLVGAIVLAILAASSRATLLRLWRKLRGWVTKFLAGNSYVLRAYLLMLAVIILVGTPIVLNTAGYRDAHRILSQTTFVDDSTQLQFFFRAQVQPVQAHWMSPTPSPLNGTHEEPEAIVNGFFLGAYNGTTIFYNLDDCSIYYLPTGSVSLVERIGASSDGAVSESPSKPQC